MSTESHMSVAALSQTQADLKASRVDRDQYSREAVHMASAIWRVGRGFEKKFRLGHPWVYSNELAESPKGLELGALVELRDAEGGFLAVGYGNPHSLISFRTLSRSKADSEIDVAFFERALTRALWLRKRAGLIPWSFRLCFGEADGLPGLIVDRFLLESGAQVFSVQASTAGMDRLKPFIFEALSKLARSFEADLGPFEKIWFVSVDDASSRRMEGIEVGTKTVASGPKGEFPEPATIRLQPVSRASQDASEARLQTSSVEVEASLLGGQKTGFFLDQRANIALAADLMLSNLRARSPSAEFSNEPSGAAPNRTKPPLRILDLFCYVGQWGAQLSSAALCEPDALERNHSGVEVTLVDASAQALELARKNVLSQGEVGRVAAIVEKRDVLETLRDLPANYYDVVICDPPAFVKKKKDLPTGQAAYAKLNREALRRLRPGGLFVSCSCSGLFVDDDFRQALGRAAAANAELDMRFLARGGHAPDHPQSPQFPQGSYLKCWIGLSGAGD